MYVLVECKLHTVNTIPCILSREHPLVRHGPFQFFIFIHTRYGVNYYSLRPDSSTAGWTLETRVYSVLEYGPCTDHGPTAQHPRSM